MSTTTIQAYKDTITVLALETYSAAQLVAHIAKMDPEYFMAAYNHFNDHFGAEYPTSKAEPKLHGKRDDNDYRQICKGNKVMAIKLYRDDTGCGLREAKDAVYLIAAQTEPTFKYD